MVRISKQIGNGKAEKLITQLSDAARRKKRTAEHIEESIAKYYQRQVLTNSISRFNREEVGQG